MSEIRGPCPHHEGNTRGSDSYSWNTYKNRGYCQSCGLKTWVGDGGDLMGKHGEHGKAFLIREGGPEITPRKPHKGQGDTMTTPKVGGHYADFRGIHKSVREFYGVLSYETETTTEQHYKYPSGGLKIRTEPGKKFTAKNLHLDELFGMNLFPAGCSKMITITEGEEDCMAAYQMLKGGSYINPVVGLPGATPSPKLWEKCKSYLDSFEKIIVSADQDEPGQKVVETMFDLFPGKVFTMDNGRHKDANDFLIAGDGAAYKNAWWKAKKFSPAGFTASADDWLKALSDEDPYEHVNTPFESYNKVGRGLVKGGITVIKAPPGSGKSSLLRCLQHHLVTKEGCKVACLMMEEVKSITGRAMATYQLGKNVMTKEDAEWNGVDEDDVAKALLEVVGDDKFVSFDINPQDPIEDTLRQCNHAIAVYGADYIWIDHLQRLAYLSGTDNATANLTSLGVKLTELAKRKNVGIIAISHVNEDGATKYAKAIEEEAIVIIELERDRFAEDMDERNTSYLTITKNRPFGSTGSAGALSYDPDTTILKEKEGPKEPNVLRSNNNDIPF